MNHNKPSRQPIRPETYLRTIFTHPQYQETLNRGNFSVAPPDERQQLRRQALSRAANFLTQQNTTPNQYVNPEGSLYKMIGQLGSFYSAQRKLDHYNAHPEEKDHRTVRGLKEQVIEFNHSLRDVIDKHPEVQTGELLGFMGQSFEQLYGSAQIDEFIYLARGHIIGMQHEVIAEQIIGTIDDDRISYTETDLEGELKGVDLYITVDDVTFPIDIKSSPAAEEQSVQRHGRHGQLWSGVPQKMIGGRFRLSYDEASSYATGMRDRLLTMATQRKQGSNGRRYSA